MTNCWRTLVVSRREDVRKVTCNSSLTSTPWPPEPDYPWNSMIHRVTKTPRVASDGRINGPPILGRTNDLPDEPATRSSFWSSSQPGVESPGARTVRTDRRKTVAKKARRDGSSEIERRPDVADRDVEAWVSSLSWPRKLIRGKRGVLVAKERGETEPRKGKERKGKERKERKKERETAEGRVPREG